MSQAKSMFYIGIRAMLPPDVEHSKPLYRRTPQTTADVAKTIETLYELGAKAKRKIGQQTDNQLLTTVKQNPGGTPYDLAQELGWQVGRVDGSLRRLQKQGKVKVKRFLKHGRVVKKIYSSDHHPKPPGIVEIPLTMLDNPKAWSQKPIMIYALSRSSIGLTPEPIEPWEHKAWKKLRIKAEAINGNIRLRLPDEMVEFYGLANSEVGLSTAKNEALLTVEATILPLTDAEDKASPSHPAKIPAGRPNPHSKPPPPSPPGGPPR